MTPVVEALLLRSAVIFLLLGSLAGLAVGTLLLWNPQRLCAISNILNRWVSTRHLNQGLDRTVEIDHLFYRYRRISGWGILLASSYVLYAFTLKLDRANAVAGLVRQFNLPAALVAGLLDAVVLSALLGALLAAFVGLFLLLRPSQLRDFEQSANRWVSLRRGLKPMEVPRGGVDEYVFKYGRQAGILLILGSLYVLVLLLFWFGQ
ncbi:MAG: hypothetical protein WAW02_05790 [Sideroxyarcus sp.]